MIHRPIQSVSELTVCLEPYSKRTVSQVLAETGFRIVDVSVEKHFGSKLVQLDEPEEVDLIRFRNSNPNPDGQILTQEVLDWGKNRKRTPFSLNRICGVALKRPDLILGLRLVALGAEEFGQVLCLWDKGNGWKGASSMFGKDGWGGAGSAYAYTFGFTRNKDLAASGDARALCVGSTTCYG